MIAFWMLIVLLAPGGPQPLEAKTVYYQALRDAREGRIEEALEGYQSILDNHPKDPFADDALMEQARIVEEEQGKPARALMLYRRLLADFPDSRLVRRARARSGFIEKHLDQGEAALHAYQFILRNSAEQPAPKAISAMEDLLKKHPDFSLRPDGLYWIGSVLARENLPERALEKWSQVVSSYPAHQAAGRSLVGMANLYIQAGGLEEAEQTLRQLSMMTDEKWKEAATEIQAKLSRARLKRIVLHVSGVIWLVVVLLLWVVLVVLKRRGNIEAKRLFHPPFEWIIFMLVMAGLIIWAATGTRQTTRVLLWMAVMIGMLVLPNGWILTAWVPRGGKLVGWLLMLVVACLAAVVVAVGEVGMTEQVLHTLKWGPA